MQVFQVCVLLQSLMYADNHMEMETSNFCAVFKTKVSYLSGFFSHLLAKPGVVYSCIRYSSVWDL